MLERLRDALPKLKLSQEQQQQIRGLLEEMRSKGTALREQAAAGDDVRAKGRELLEETRKRVDEILTPEQREKLRATLSEPAAPTTRAMTMEEGQDMMMAGERRGSARKAAPSAEAGDQTKAPVGAAAPQFALKKLDGSLVQLSALKGRVLVLEFGSWTCPAFRERAAAMEKLRNDYSTRAQFFIVYTREAHAKDEWEVVRNKDEEIVVEQPKSSEARVELAKKAREQLKLATPLLIDSMGNDTAIAYGAGANSAVVINRDGMIVARQQWFDPAGLRRAIDQAVKATPTTKP
jgi:peroxiredoxin